MADDRVFPLPRHISGCHIQPEMWKTSEAEMMCFCLHGALLSQSWLASEIYRYGDFNSTQLQNNNDDPDGLVSITLAGTPMSPGEVQGSFGLLPMSSSFPGSQFSLLSSTRCI